MSWLTQVHPEYAALNGKWAYTRDHYEARVLDPDKIDTYLVKRNQGESREAWQERKDLADYTPHFSAVVDTLAGRLFHVEENAERVFNTDTGRGLGDPRKINTPIGRLWHDADRKGNGYPTLFRQLASQLIHSHRAWIMVDGGRSGNARIQILSPLQVTNWMDEDGRVVEALVQESVDLRTSLRDQVAQARSYVHITREGWTRYVLEKDETGELVAREKDAGFHRFEDPAGNPVLPIFPVELPLKRLVGYTLARKANAIFNQESQRDHLLRAAHFPKLNLVADDELFDALVEALKEGSNLLQNDPENGSTHTHTSPNAGPAKTLNAVLERKVSEFWRTAFREYSDSAQERTATEVRQDVASGVGAFLQLLKSAIDDAENQVLWRVSQIEFPQDRDLWFTARVQRPSDFLPPDLDVLLENKRKRYFGETDPVPVGRSGLVQVVRQIAEHDGLDLDESEIAAAIDTQQTAGLLDLLETLPVPAQVRTEMVLRVIQSLNLISPEETVTLEDGTEVSLLEQVRNAAASLAESRDEGSLRQGRAFGGPEAF